MSHTVPTFPGVFNLEVNLRYGLALLYDVCRFGVRHSWSRIVSADVQDKFAVEGFLEEAALPEFDL